MLVSIVTVCFNSEKTVRHTIESVLKQDYKNIEYLIIDGCSKDNTVAIAKEYEEKFAEKGYIYKIVSENTAEPSVSNGKPVSGQTWSTSRPTVY